MYVYETAMLSVSTILIFEQLAYCQGSQDALGHPNAVLFTHSFLETRELVKLVTLNRLSLGS
jgi:hypothetical protein